MKYSGYAVQVSGYNDELNRLEPRILHKMDRETRRDDISAVSTPY